MTGARSCPARTEAGGISSNVGLDPVASAAAPAPIFSGSVLVSADPLRVFFLLWAIFNVSGAPLELQHPHDGLFLLLYTARILPTGRLPKDGAVGVSLQKTKPHLTMASCKCKLKLSPPAKSAMTPSKKGATEKKSHSRTWEVREKMQPYHTMRSFQVCRA